MIIGKEVFRTESIAIGKEVRTCSECEHHKSDAQEGNGFAYIGFYCNDPDSPYYTEFTEGYTICPKETDTRGAE